MSKFKLEQFVIEKATNNVFFVLGTPINCRIYSTGEPGYVISNRAGMTILLSQSEMENGDFILRNDSHPPIY